MFSRASSVERQMQAASRGRGRLTVLKDEQSSFEASDTFERDQTLWDPRRVGLSSHEPERNVVAFGRLCKEMDEVKKNPVKHCRAAPRGDNIHEWIAVIEGPEDTVYEGGTFFVELLVPLNYPFEPPKLKFLTRIYHCNISSRGIVRMDILSRWSSSYTISNILEDLIKLLCHCIPDDAVDERIAKQYIEDRKEFETTARSWTLRFAH